MGKSSIPKGLQKALLQPPVVVQPPWGQVRRNALRELARVLLAQTQWDTLHVRPYATQLEQAVFIQAQGQLLDYQAKAAQLAWALEQNGAHLAETYPAGALTDLDDQALTATTPLQRIFTEHAFKMHAFSNMILDTDRKVHDVEAQVAKVTGHSGALQTRCTGCGGTKISWDQKQTKGGDEAMTTFYKCENPRCRRTWKG